jgi:hypothetical protein
MARNPNAVRRTPRLMQPQTVLGKEANAFAPTTQADQEGLASLAYLSNVGDTNRLVSNFVASMSNSVFSQYMNNSLQGI